MWLQGNQSRIDLDGEPGQLVDRGGDLTDTIRYLSVGGALNGTRRVYAVLDELRISTVSRTDEWIKLSYLSMTNALLEYLDVESEPG